jgi:hypothetical protein
MSEIVVCVFFLRCFRFPLSITTCIYKFAVATSNQNSENKLIGNAQRAPLLLRNLFEEQELNTYCRNICVKV